MSDPLAVGGSSDASGGIDAGRLRAVAIALAAAAGTIGDPLGDLARSLPLVGGQDRSIGGGTLEGFERSLDAGFAPDIVESPRTGTDQPSGSGKSSGPSLAGDVARSPGIGRSPVEPFERAVATGDGARSPRIGRSPVEPLVRSDAGAGWRDELVTGGDTARDELDAGGDAARAPDPWFGSTIVSDGTLQSSNGTGVLELFAAAAAGALARSSMIGRSPVEPFARADEPGGGGGALGDFGRSSVIAWAPVGLFAPTPCC